MQSDKLIHFKGEVILRVGLLLLKYIWRDDLTEQLGQILGLLQELAERQTGLEYLQTILRYISGAADKISEDELKQVVTELFTEGEMLMPTIAEQWIEQGRIEGLEEGREAALTILRRFLAQRFGVALDYFDDDFQVLELADITHLSEAAFEAATLAEFKTKMAELVAKSANRSNLKPEPPAQI
jgi:hypothetical protein